MAMTTFLYVLMMIVIR